MPKLANWIWQMIKQGNSLEITVKEVEHNRSNAQNRLLWGVFHKEACVHLKEHYGVACSPDALHEEILVLLGYYKEKTGLNGFVKVRESTSKMSSKRFCKFLTDYEQYALENWQLQFSHPDDLYLMAMLKQEKSNG